LRAWAAACALSLLLDIRALCSGTLVWFFGMGHVPRQIIRLCSLYCQLSILEPYTLHPTIINDKIFTFLTLNLSPYTLHPTPYTLNDKTLHS
jgi:hypothetical protein